MNATAPRPRPAREGVIELARTGMMDCRIAQTLGVSRERVRQLRVVLGIPKNSRPKPPPKPRRDPNALSPRQMAVLEWCRAAYAASGRFPTLREIAAGVGAASENGARMFLLHLVSKGKLRPGRRGPKGRVVAYEFVDPTT